MALFSVGRGVVTARELQYLTLVFGTHRVFVCAFVKHRCCNYDNYSCLDRSCLGSSLSRVQISLFAAFLPKMTPSLKALPSKPCSSQLCVHISESQIICRSLIMACKYPVHFYETKFRNFSQRNVTKLISK